MKKQGSLTPDEPLPPKQPYTTAFSPVPLFSWAARVKFRKSYKKAGKPAFL